MAFHKTINALSLPTLALFTYTPLRVLTKHFFSRVSPCCGTGQTVKSNLFQFNLPSTFEILHISDQINAYHNTKYEVQNLRNQHLLDYNQSSLAWKIFHIKRQFSTNLPLVCVAITLSVKDSKRV